VPYRRKTLTFAISSDDEFLFVFDLLLTMIYCWQFYSTKCEYIIWHTMYYECITPYSSSYN